MGLWPLEICLLLQRGERLYVSFHTIENILDFFTAKGFRRHISMKLLHEYIVVFFNLSSTSNHLDPLQVENCDSNSRLVVDEDLNGKFRLERVISHRGGNCG